MCRLSDTPCNWHAPCCRLWLAPPYNTFSTRSLKRHDFQKKLLGTKCVFWLPLQRLSDIFHILRRTERDIIKFTLIAKQSLSSCDFIDTSMISASFGKIVKYQISGKSVLWEQSCSMRTVGWTKVRTQRQTWRS